MKSSSSPQLNNLIPFFFQGAFWANMIGLVLGGSRFTLDMIYESTPCGFEDERPMWVKYVQIHYMYFALFMFLFTAFCATVISLCTDPIPPECVSIIFKPRSHSPQNSIFMYLEVNLAPYAVIAAIHELPRTKST